jgi:hypothetical protein
MGVPFFVPSTVADSYHSDSHVGLHEDHEEILLKSFSVLSVALCVLRVKEVKVR